MVTLTFRIIFAAALVSLTFGFPAAWLARRLNLIDVPGKEAHKFHRQPTPMAGGLLILVTLLAAGGVLGILELRETYRLLLPSLIVFAFGMLDDIRSLRPQWKLVGQALGAAALIYSGVQVQLFVSLPWLNILTTALWLVAITNAFNFVDSMDGLATGISALTAGFLTLVTYDSGQLVLSMLSALLLGTCVGMFFFTAPPARFFLGDSGSQFLGFLLGSLAIAYNPLGFQPTQSWYIPILLFGMPLFDLLLIFFSRLRRHKPIYRSGLDHTYHRLVAFGMDPLRATLSMQFASLFLGFLAFLSLSLPPLAGNAIFAACVLAGVTGILYLDSPRRWPARPADRLPNS